MTVIQSLYLLYIYIVSKSLSILVAFVVYVINLQRYSEVIINKELPVVDTGVASKDSLIKKLCTYIVPLWTSKGTHNHLESTRVSATIFKYLMGTRNVHVWRVCRAQLAHQQCWPAMVIRVFLDSRRLFTEYTRNPKLETQFIMVLNR